MTYKSSNQPEISLVFISLNGRNLAKPMKEMLKKDGTYAIDGIPPGVYNMYVFSIGYDCFEIAEITIADKETKIMDFDLYPDESYFTDTFLLEAMPSYSMPLDKKGNGIIEGHVRDSNSNVPLGKALVWVETPKGKRLKARTEPDGSFRIGKVPHGKYALNVALGGYEPQVYNPVYVITRDDLQWKSRDVFYDVYLDAAD